MQSATCRVPFPVWVARGRMSGKGWLCFCAALRASPVSRLLENVSGILRIVPTPSVPHKIRLTDCPEGHRDPATGPTGSAKFRGPKIPSA